MASPHPRALVIDDADPSITYAAQGWTQRTDGKESEEGFGPVYLKTLREGSSTANLSFAFEGTEVRLFGFQRPGGPGGSGAARSCTVDGAPATVPQQGRVLCQWNGGSGSHTLQFSGSDGQTTFVDKIEYVPPSGASTPPDSVVSVHHKDTAIRYEGQWSSFQDIGTQTSASGARLQLDFEGTQLAWWGFNPDNSGTSGPAQVSYRVDDRPEENVTIQPSQQGSPFNQKLFEITGLPPGPHRLTVVYQGSGQNIPLTLIHLVIQGGSLISSPPPPASSESPASESPLSVNPTSTEPISSPSSALSSPAPTSRRSSSPLIPSVSSAGQPTASATAGNDTSGNSSESSSGRKTPVGAIVGGVVGGVALLLAAILLFLFLRRRKARNRIAPSERYMQTMRGTFASPTPQEQEQMQPLHEKQSSVASSADAAPRGSLDRRGATAV